MIASAAVLNLAVGDLWAYQHLLPPPYLVFAVVEPDGQVRRIRLIAAYADGTHLVPIESGYEGAFAAHLISRGLAFAKAMLTNRTESGWRRLLA